MLSSKRPAKASASRSKSLEGHETLAATQREGLRDAGQALARGADFDDDSSGVADTDQVKSTRSARQGRAHAFGGSGFVETALYPQIGSPMSCISPNSSPKA